MFRHKLLKANFLLSSVKFLICWMFKAPKNHKPNKWHLLKWRLWVIQWWEVWLLLNHKQWEVEPLQCQKVRSLQPCHNNNKWWWALCNLQTMIWWWALWINLIWTLWINLICVKQNHHKWCVLNRINNHLEWLKKMFVRTILFVAYYFKKLHVDEEDFIQTLLYH